MDDGRWTEGNQITRRSGCRKSVNQSIRIRVYPVSCYPDTHDPITRLPDIQDVFNFNLSKNITLQMMHALLSVASHRLVRRLFCGEVCILRQIVFFSEQFAHIGLEPAEPKEKVDERE